jgi:23S rRNA (adenine2503-C2)-methyltransferase
MKVKIKEFNMEELKEFVKSLGLEPYRAKQIAHWLYKKRVSSFDDMTNLSKEARKLLKERAEVELLKLVKVEESRDGTKKYLFELKDGSRVESVFIPEKGWNTLCVSTQVGCPVGCRFCLTAKDGFTRNLTAGEIVEQYIHVQRDVGEERRISNVVFMGMGEPLLNFDNVKKAVEIMVDRDMLDLSTRKITISTVGIVPGIERMAKELNKVKLALSLHATTDRVRELLVPLNRKYPIRELFKALRKYPADNVRRIMIEYVMLKGVNDSLEDAHRLAKLVKGLPVKVNLIPFNPYPGAPFEPTPREEIERFQKVLWDYNIATFIRDSRGQDISAACGMLRTKEKQVQTA